MNYTNPWKCLYFILAIYVINTKWLLSLVFLVMILGCAQPKDQAPSSGAPAPKVLISVWQSTDPHWVLDLSLVSKNAFLIKVTYPSGGICKLTANITDASPVANQYETGTINIISFDDSDLKAGDPTCAQFQGQWSFDLFEGQQLEMCSAISCVWFT